MWTFTKETSVLKKEGRSFPIYQWSLVNANGVRVEFRGENREHGETLRYVDDDLSFQFYATRYEQNGKVLSEKYKVWPSAAYRRLWLNADIRPRLVLGADTIKLHIEEALRLWAIKLHPTAGVPISRFEFVGFEEPSSAAL